MRKWTGYWFCALILGSATVQVRAVEPDPCIPPDTIFAMKVRPRQILTSALVKDLGWNELFKTTLAAEGPVQEFLDTAGLRIDRDLESILWCQSCSPFIAHFYCTSCCENLDTGEKTFFNSKTGQPLASGEKDPIVTGLVVLEGRFNQKNIIKALEKHGLQAGAPIRKTNIEGTRLLQVQMPKGPLYIVFQDKNRILLSNQKKVVQNCLAGGFDKPISPKMAESLSRVSETDSFWAIHAVDKNFLESLNYLVPMDDKFTDLPTGIAEDLVVGQISLQLSNALVAKMGFSTKSEQAKTALGNLGHSYIQKTSSTFDQALLIINKEGWKPEYGRINTLEAKLRLCVIFSLGKQFRAIKDRTFTGINIHTDHKSLDPILSLIKAEGE